MFTGCMIERLLSGSGDGPGDGPLQAAVVLVRFKSGNGPIY